MNLKSIVQKAFYATAMTSVLLAAQPASAAPFDFIQTTTNSVFDLLKNIADVAYVELDGIVNPH
ncbi:hypothetical protein [Pseudomonas fluorescens]|uniref:hypothetical protein n=1 Tax=Pseudomonas fluorescens TaxID=294 RepID=UPI001BE90A56|nr:hypothetical protein [Pseudomonas fluorescens]MBT2375760.1 hypothetical protein [Pseudomonas fluorescens]